MKLPLGFIEQMNNMLKEEADDFFKSLEKENRLGLRVNTLKISVEEFLKISPFELEPIPWTTDGFYFDDTERPAKHPYYHCGLYYLQEPSAMAPVSVMNLKPESFVLDLCAAPGGKTIQIAGKLDGSGLIITNDISTGRVKPLVKNIELCGIKNAIVLNENHINVFGHFTDFFDNILIDAPCSGEGMFRKDKAAVEAWESHGVERCNEIQKDIIDKLPEALKEGGEMVYSTCTFNTTENEAVIKGLLDSEEDFEVVEIEERFGFRKGFAIQGDQRLVGTARLFPHIHEGEGHYLAKVRKHGEAEPGGKSNSTQPPTEFEEFAKANLSFIPEGFYEVIKDKIYLLPPYAVSTKGLRVARSGWLLGEVKRGRFKPAQSLAMGLKKEDAKRMIDISLEDINAIKYLKGESIQVEGEKGLNLICIEGFPVGWGRLSGSMLKNDYPPAWRYM